MTYQPTPEELESFYSSLGKTISEFHKFEFLVAVALCVIKNDEFKGIDEARDALDSDFKKTLGKLITQLNSNVYFVDTFRYHLAEIVHDRNWIVHRLPRAIYLYVRDKYEFPRLISRLDITRDSCSSIRSMLERWFFSSQEYEAKIRDLPSEVLINFEALKLI